jgi:hypothetical protein
MYRGRRAMISWTMTTMLTVASALGVVAVSHAILAPAAVSASPATIVAPTTTHKVVYTTYRGDDGSAGSSSGSTANNFNN